MDLHKCLQALQGCNGRDGESPVPGRPGSRAGCGDKLARCLGSESGSGSKLARCPGCPPAGGRLEAVSSSARWEDVVGYSRAVKRGPLIFVSGKW